MTGIATPDDTRPFVSRMEGRWGAARAREWTLAALPDRGIALPSEGVLSRVLDAVPARFHAVSVAEDFARVRTVVEVGATMLFPGVASRIADAVVGALDPAALVVVGRVRRALRASLRTIREPLGLVALVAEGDRVVETKLYWTCASMDERAMGGFSCEPSDEPSASRALASLAAVVGADPVDPALVRTMYAAGAGLDGVGFDWSEGTRSAIKPYFAPRDGDGAVVRAAFSRPATALRARRVKALLDAVAANPGCVVEDVASEGRGDEVKLYVSVARLVDPTAATLAVRALCSAWGRDDMGARTCELAGRLARVGGRVSSLGFDVAGDGSAEVKAYLWPCVDYAAPP